MIPNERINQMKKYKIYDKASQQYIFKMDHRAMWGIFNPYA